MNTTEKLQAIRAKCVELLDIASKRTQGEWFKCNSSHTTRAPSIYIKPSFIRVAEADCSSDSAFIATCAGPAEAGWKSTIAAIDALEAAHVALLDGDDTAWNGIAAILTAWEGIV